MISPFSVFRKKRDGSEPDSDSRPSLDGAQFGVILEDCDQSVSLVDVKTIVENLSTVVKTDLLKSGRRT